MKEKGQLRSFEYLITTIHIHGTVLCLVIIYHAPYSKASRITTSNGLPDIILKYQIILVLGDFNLHLDDSEDMDAILSKDILHAMGLISYVNFRTHIAGHTLNQVYTVLGSRLTVRKCTQDPLISDHYTGKGCVVVPYISTTTRYIQSRKLKAIDINFFIKDINTGDIRLQNTNEAVAAFDTELLRVLDKHAPVKTIKISDRKKEVSYDGHIKLQKKFTGRTKTNPMPPGKTDKVLADVFAYSPTHVDIGLAKIGDTITAIVNNSLMDGVFTDLWKEAIVRPLLKKSGLVLAAKNYRPVSNLLFLSKVVEKCMLVHFNSHCEKNHLLPEHQSSYRKHYSCKTALVKMMDDILWAMENQHIMAVSAIDLSTAIDTVDHDILCKIYIRML